MKAAERLLHVTAVQWRCYMMRAADRCAVSAAMRRGDMYDKKRATSQPWRARR